MLNTRQSVPERSSCFSRKKQLTWFLFLRHPFYLFFFRFCVLMFFSVETNDRIATRFSKQNTTIANNEMERNRSRLNFVAPTTTFGLSSIFLFHTQDIRTQNVKLYSISYIQYIISCDTSVSCHRNWVLCCLLITSSVYHRVSCCIARLSY